MDTILAKKLKILNGGYQEAKRKLNNTSLITKHLRDHLLVTVPEGDYSFYIGIEKIDEEEIVFKAFISLLPQHRYNRDDIDAEKWREKVIDVLGISINDVEYTRIEKIDEQGMVGYYESYTIDHNDNWKEASNTYRYSAVKYVSHHLKIHYSHHLKDV